MTDRMTEGRRDTILQGPFDYCQGSKNTLAHFTTSFYFSFTFLSTLKFNVKILLPNIKQNVCLVILEAKEIPDL